MSGVFAAILEGLGAGLVAKGQIDEKREEEALLMQREMALKQVEFQHDDQVAATNHADRLAEITATGAENRRTDLFKGVIDSRIQSQRDAATTQREITLKGIDFSNSAKLAGLTHKYKLDETQQELLQKSLLDAQNNGQIVDRAVFSKNGQLQLIMKNGDVVSKGPSGAYNPGGSSSDGLDALLNNQAGTNSGSTGTSGAGISVGAPQPPPATGIGPAPASPTPPVNTGKAAAMAALGNAYAQASANPQAMRTKYPGMFDSSGNLLPKDQLIAQVNQAYGG